MASPLTWRNVSAPSFSGAGSLLRDAQQSFNQGLGGLGRALSDAQEVQQFNRKAEVERNDEDFLSNIRQQYGQDPAALQAAMQDGSIQAAREAFGQGNLTAEKTNFDAINNLRTAAQGDILKQRQFDDSQTQFNNRDAVNTFNTALLNDDFGAATSALENIGGDKNKYLQALDADIQGVKREEERVEDRQTKIADDNTARARSDYTYNRKITADKKQDMAEKIGGDALNNFNKDIFGYESEVKNIQDRMQKDGIDIDNLTGADPAKVASYKAELISLGPRPNETPAFKDLINKFAAEGYGASSSSRAHEVFQARQIGEGLSPQDATRYNKALKSNNDNYANSALVKDELAGVTPAQVIEEVSLSIQDKVKHLDIPEMSALYNTIQTAMTTGIDLGSGKVKLPSSLIKTATNSLSREDWLSFNNTRDNVEEMLKGMISNDAAVKYKEDYANWISGRNALNLQFGAISNPTQNFEDTLRNANTTSPELGKILKNAAQ